MGYKDQQPVFLLCRDYSGWRESSSLYQEQQDTVPVPRGSLLVLAEASQDVSRLVTVTVRVTDLQGVKATLQTKDMQEVTGPGGEFLAAVMNLDTRYQLLTCKQLGAKAGDKLLYRPPGERPVPAVVRYVGGVPELRSRGHMLGLEVTCRDWKAGHTNGTYGRRTYFRADPTKGVMCDVSQVAVEDIHSKERLESLNKGTVERIALLIDKTSLTDNNNVKNVNMNEEYGREYGRPAKIENYRVVERAGRGGGGHSNIHQDRQPQSSPQDIRVQQVHPQVRREPRGDNYSWDPNSSSKARQRSRQSSTSQAREGLRETREGSRGRLVEQGSRLVVTLRESPDSRSSSRTGGEEERGRLGEGRHSPWGWQAEEGPRRSASGSTNIDMGQAGEDREETSPPCLPPRDRDCFLTPQDQGDSWGRQQEARENSCGRQQEVKENSWGRHQEEKKGSWGRQQESGGEAWGQQEAKENSWGQQEAKENSWGQQEGRSWGQVLGSRTPSPKPRAVSPSEEELLGQESLFAPLCSGREGEVGFESMVQLATPQGEHLFGVVRYVGDLGGGQPGRWAGVEMENELKGGHGGQVGGRRLFSCPPGKGVVVPLTHLVPDPRFAESLPQQQDFGGIECPAVTGYLPPRATVQPDTLATVSGRNKGIQGHQNSCYLDATLFSMFCFTSAFDSLLYRPRNKEDISKYEEVQKVLRDDIVNPLRSQLYVRADRVMSLRTLLDGLSDVTGLTDQEKDPEEFLSSLLTQVMKCDPFLELSSGQSAHHYQLFVERDPDLPLPSVQDLFDQSFNSSRVKLKKAPPVLILQMPRFGRQFKVYDRILPSQLLDVTDILEASPRQCVICGVLAEYECDQCFGDHDSGLQSTAFCQNCATRTHQHARRNKHRPERLKEPPGWVKRPAQPIPRIFMELVAVVCIETSHYVSFVRCGDSPRAPWCFFDSMADRKGEQNGYNIPELTPAPEVEKILSDSGAADFRANRSGAMGEQVKRLVSDAYMCFYQSPDVRMYR